MSISRNIDLKDVMEYVYENNYALFLKLIEIRREMFKEYLKQSLEYLNNLALNMPISQNYIIIGDVHGSIIQLFAPLVKYQLIKNVGYDFNNNKFTFDYIYGENNTKIIYVGDIISRSCHAYGFPLLEALIEIENHFNIINKSKSAQFSYLNATFQDSGNVIYLNGNHELGFMLYTDNSYGLYEYEFDEYVSIYENGLNRKNEILNEKRKIIYQHLINSDHPFMYSFNANNSKIIISHTIQYVNDIPITILNNIKSLNSTDEVVKYLNNLVKDVFSVSNKNYRLKEELIIALFCKRPSGNFGLSEYLDKFIGSEYDKLDEMNDNQTIYNSRILDEFIIKENDFQSKIHIIGHTPTYSILKENDEQYIKYIDNNLLNLRLYFNDCNSSNDYKNDNSMMMIINDECINSFQIKSEFHLEKYIDEMLNAKW